MLPSSNESSMLATVTSIIAIQSFRFTLSPKNSRAISAVATISKLLSKEVLDAEHVFKPYIIKIGAAMSSTTIATAYGISFLCSRSSVVLCLPLRTSIMAPMPMPAPRYRNAATIVGATVWSITFETGVLMAYRAAASIAKSIAMRFLSLAMLLICIYPSDNSARIANSY